jgi:acyl-CoA synthetase (AMP-forming)/AMP-acid ligase II
MTPFDYRFLAEMPLSANGKIDRALVREVHGE